MRTITKLFRRGLHAFGHEVKRDDGILALVIAIALIAGAAALIASSARQNKEAEVARLSGNAKSVKLIQNSIVAYYLSDNGAGGINGRIVCPDSDQDGDADGTTTCTTTAGTLPWLTLGLSREDAIDAYGNYFTYAVSGSDESRQVCTFIESDYSNDLDQYTGSANDVTDTEVRLSSQSAGQGQPYYYAVISHGKNGLGAISGSGNIRSPPTTSAERENCPTAAGCSGNDALVIYSGPSSTDASTYFDDTVYVGSTQQLTQLCESLSPGGEANADVTENFSDVADGDLPDSLTDDSGGGTAGVGDSASGSNNRVLVFSGGGSPAVATEVLNFNTAARAQYIAFEWSPTTLGTGGIAGISVATRATVASRDPGSDIFNTGDDDGLTFRFYTAGTDNSAMSGGVNQIFICDSATPACNNVMASNRRAISGNFNIIADAIYLVEVYDDGVQVWGRITQQNVSTPNTASAFFAAYDDDENDLGGDNAIVLINNGDSTSEIDNFIVARGGMGVAFDGDGDIVETVGDSHDTGTGDLTLEAWIKPDSLPTGSGQSAIIAKWQDGGVDSAQAYKLYLRAGGALSLQLAGGTSITTPVYNFGGYVVRVGRWDHIVVTYDLDEAVAKLYVNRALISRVSADAFDTEGINDGSAIFSVGAQRNTSNAVVNVFHGTITDVRVWDVARTAEEIFANYDRRLPLAGTVTNLIVNWTMDRDTNSTFGGNVSVTGANMSGGAPGTVTGAAFVGIHQRHFPVFASSTFCAVPGGAQGAIVTPYQCDYRLTSQSNSISVPNNLGSFYVKAWGGGGGGYDFDTNDSTGGGGGFSAGRLTTINDTTIIGSLSLRVDVGGGGGASSAVNNGAGGGGASGIWLDTLMNDVVNAGTDFAGVIAGGGGGASSGNDDQSGAGGPNCDTQGNCGPGGGGGGPNNFTLATATVALQAPDQNTLDCGGRPGHNSTFPDPPPTAAYCDAGSDDDDASTNGGDGGGTAVGGASIIGQGGDGYNGNNNDAGMGGPTDSIGAGGGGGGVRASGMSGGGGEAGAYDGSGMGIDDDGDAAPNDNGSGFGGGGGAGFVDEDATGVLGAAARAALAVGNEAAPGGASDPDYAGTGYCVSGGTPCLNIPGRGGEPAPATTNTTGKPGAVIIKW